MYIKLERPLATFDLEATGLNITSDRIVEIAIVRVDPDGKKMTYERRINPEMEISEEATAVHGISNEDVANAPTLKDVVSEVIDFIKDCDLAGFNSNKFDLPMLAEELLRVGSDYDLSQVNHIDVQNIFHKMEQRTLSAAYQFYCNKSLENAHAAFADAEATWEVLDAQVAKYSELENNVDFLATFSLYGDVKRADFAGRLAYNKNGEVTYNFGKHKGKSVAQVAKEEPGYYGWMMDADFPLYTKQQLKAEMERIKAKRSEHKEKSFENKLDALKNKFNS